MQNRSILFIHRLAFGFVYFVFVYGCTHVMMCLWRSEESLKQSVLFLRLVGSQNWIQVVRFGGKHCYSLSHLTSPIKLF